MPGDTIGEVLTGLTTRYPDLRDQLLAEDGALNRFVVVYLNNEDIRYLAELATPVEARDTIVILPAMAGGSAASCDSPPAR